MRLQVLEGGTRGSPAFMYIREHGKAYCETRCPVGSVTPGPSTSNATTNPPRECRPSSLHRHRSSRSPPWTERSRFEKTTMGQVRVKSSALTDMFIALVEDRLPGHFEIVTPKQHAKRGSQVALRHRDGYAIVQALIERGVIGDFRDPDICRFGFTPLYLRFVDVFDAVERLVEVMHSEMYKESRFRVQNAVT